MIAYNIIKSLPIKRGKSVLLDAVFFFVGKRKKKAKIKLLGQTLQLDLTDNAAKGLFLNDGIPHEKGLQAILKQLVEKKDIKSIWDVGGNLGYYVAFVLSLNKESQITSFEPNAKLFKQLEINFQGKPGVILINQGLGEACKEIPFFYSDKRSDIGSFVSDASIFNKSHSLLNITTGDDFFKLNNENPPQLIKIDVEGFEYNVIYGMRETIKKYKPIIIMEWIEKLFSKNEFASKFDALAFLHELGYQKFHINYNGALSKDKTVDSSSDILFTVDPI
jgi:FkbM family methyltransferase